MATTIAQIAQEAGVSIGTVSRVLNGKNKENRPAIARRSQKIREIAQKHGYRPNLAARTVRSGKFGTVGFLSCSDPGSDIFEISLLHGIQSGLAKFQSRLMMCELPQSEFEEPTSIPQVLGEYSVDGLLIDYLWDLSENVLELIRGNHMPYVWLNAKRRFNCAYPDDLMGGELAARHMIEFGHERIAFVSYHQHHDGFIHYSVQDRYQGFVNCMEEAGLEPVACDLSGGFVEGVGQKKAYELLSRSDRPSAVVCYEKHEAVAVYLAASMLGLKVPEDLSIIGFSSDLLRNVTGLPITTMVIPFTAVGEAAVDMLYARIEGDAKDLPAQSLPYTIEEPGSCSPAPPAISQ